VEAEEESDEDEEEEVEEVLTYSNSVPPTQMLQESDYGRATVDDVLVTRITLFLGTLLMGWLGFKWYQATHPPAAAAAEKPKAA